MPVWGKYERRKAGDNVPTVKLYNVVTADELELPVCCDLIGAKSVADYLGVTENVVRQSLCRNHDIGKYRVVVTGEYTNPMTHFEMCLHRAELARLRYRRRKKEE